VSTDNQWRRCNACKEPIDFGAEYWVCSVSTCNRKRTALAFCSVTCWEVHLPVANHREAWAEERRAPLASEAEARASDSQAKEISRRRIVRDPVQKSRAPEPSADVLIVASRLKQYIHGKSGFSTSDRVLDPLSDIVRRVCDEAIQNAAREGRKTVLDRDIRSG
jgi:hypothetical protein